MFLSVKARKLTLYAALTGGIMTFCIYAGAGYIGVILLSAFFILGSVATSFKYNEKKEMAIHEENQGRRSAGQVFANAGLAGIISILSLIFPENRSLYLLMIAAVFSSATSDTLSSELGNLYGKRYYNILTFKKDIKGLNGVVSIEGTLLGMVGSVIIAALVKGFLLDNTCRYNWKSFRFHFRCQSRTT